MNATFSCHLTDFLSPKAACRRSNLKKPLEVMEKQRESNWKAGRGDATLKLNSIDAAVAVQDISSF